MRDLNALTLDDLFLALTRDGCTQRLLEIARDEDLGGAGGRGDVTTVSIIDSDTIGEAKLVLREPGVVAGLAVIPMLIEVFGAGNEWTPAARDGRVIDDAPFVLGSLRGRLCEILMVERTLLNLVARLSGIATTARTYVQTIRGTGAVICDTRKTTPGLRSLEKYAVRCGGATLHRIGLFDAVLYKDNHLSHIPEGELTTRVTKAARRAREAGDLPFVEIEVDSLSQFEQILACDGGLIDIVLLDNLEPDDLHAAVRMKSGRADAPQLEASGGISIDTVRAIAESGVDRISIGAMTHHAVSLDVGLDSVPARRA